MQYVGCHYSAGNPVDFHQMHFPSTAENTNGNTTTGVPPSTTSVLRSWRKKDASEKQPLSTVGPTPAPAEQPNANSANGQTSETQGPVARVAPHTHYPKLPPQVTTEAYRYPQQYGDFGVQGPQQLPTPVKYSEIIEPMHQGIEQLPPQIHLHQKQKEKTYLEMCSVQQNHMKSYQDYPNYKQHYDGLKSYNHLAPSGYNKQFHPHHAPHYALQKESQVSAGYPVQKDATGPTGNIPPPPPPHQYLHNYKMSPPASYPREIRNYPRDASGNEFLANLNKIAPDMAQDIINDPHLRESQFPMYPPTIDQNRLYHSQPQQHHHHPHHHQRMYQRTSPIQHPIQNYAHQRNLQNFTQYPPSMNQQRIAPDPYRMYAPPHQRYQVGQVEQVPSNFSPRQYHENVIGLPPRISPNYAPCSQLEYAQHYQHRQVPMRQEFLPIPNKPYIESHPDIPEIVPDDSIHAPKNTLKTFLENWREEFTEDPDAAGEVGPNSEKIQLVKATAGGPNRENTLYVLDTVEIPSENIPQYLHLQPLEKLPPNIRAFTYNSNEDNSSRQNAIVISTNMKSEVANKPEEVDSKEASYQLFQQNKNFHPNIALNSYKNEDISSHEDRPACKLLQSMANAKNAQLHDRVIENQEKIVRNFEENHKQMCRSLPELITEDTEDMNKNQDHLHSEYSEIVDSILDENIQGVNANEIALVNEEEENLDLVNSTEIAGRKSVIAENQHALPAREEEIPGDKEEKIEEYRDEERTITKVTNQHLKSEDKGEDARKRLEDPIDLSQSFEESQENAEDNKTATVEEINPEENDIDEDFIEEQDTKHVYTDILSYKHLLNPPKSPENEAKILEEEKIANKEEEPHVEIPDEVGTVTIAATKEISAETRENKEDLIPDEVEVDTISDTIIDEETAVSSPTIEDKPEDNEPDKSEEEILADATEIPGEEEILPDATEIPAESEILPDVTEIPTDEEVLPDGTEIPGESEILPDATKITLEEEILPDATELATESEILPDGSEIPTESKMLTDATEIRREAEILPDATQVPTEEEIKTVKYPGESKNITQNEEFLQIKTAEYAENPENIDGNEEVLQIKTVEYTEEPEDINENEVVLQITDNFEDTIEEVAHDEVVEPTYDTSAGDLAMEVEEIDEEKESILLEEAVVELSTMHVEKENSEHIDCIKDNMKTECQNAQVTTQCEDMDVEDRVTEEVVDVADAKEDNEGCDHHIQEFIITEDVETNNEIEVATTDITSFESMPINTVETVEDIGEEVIMGQEKTPEEKVSSLLHKETVQDNFFEEKEKNTLEEHNSKTDQVVLEDNNVELIEEIIGGDTAKSLEDITETDDSNPIVLKYGASAPELEIIEKGDTTNVTKETFGSSFVLEIAKELLQINVIEDHNGEKIISVTPLTKVKVITPATAISEEKHEEFFEEKAAEISDTPSEDKETVAIEDTSAIEEVSLVVSDVIDQVVRMEEARKEEMVFTAQINDNINEVSEVIIETCGYMETSVENDVKFEEETESNEETILENDDQIIDSEMEIHNEVIIDSKEEVDIEIPLEPVEYKNEKIPNSLQEKEAIILPIPTEDAITNNNYIKDISCVDACEGKRELVNHKPKSTRASVLKQQHKSTRPQSTRKKNLQNIKKKRVNFDLPTFKKVEALDNIEKAKLFSSVVVIDKIPDRVLKKNASHKEKSISNGKLLNKSKNKIRLQEKRCRNSVNFSKFKRKFDLARDKKVPIVKMKEVVSKDSKEDRKIEDKFVSINPSPTRETSDGTSKIMIIPPKKIEKLPSPDPKHLPPSTIQARIEKLVSSHTSSEPIKNQEEPAKIIIEPPKLNDTQFQRPNGILKPYKHPKDFRRTKSDDHLSSEFLDTFKKRRLSLQEYNNRKRKLHNKLDEVKKLLDTKIGEENEDTVEKSMVEEVLKSLNSEDMYAEEDKGSEAGKPDNVLVKCEDFSIKEEKCMAVESCESALTEDVKDSRIEELPSSTNDVKENVLENDSQPSSETLESIQTEIIPNLSENFEDKPKETIDKSTIEEKVNSLEIFLPKIAVTRMETPTTPRNVEESDISRKLDELMAENPISYTQKFNETTLINRFLNREVLTPEELARVTQIVQYKRAIQSLQKPNVTEQSPKRRYSSEFPKSIKIDFRDFDIRKSENINLSGCGESFNQAAKVCYNRSISAFIEEQSKRNTRLVKDHMRKDAQFARQSKEVYYHNNNNICDKANMPSTNLMADEIKVVSDRSKEVDQVEKNAPESKEDPNKISAKVTEFNSNTEGAKKHEYSSQNRHSILSIISSPKKPSNIKDRQDSLTDEKPAAPVIKHAIQNIIKIDDKCVKIEDTTPANKLYLSNVVQAKDKSAKIEESTQEIKLFLSNVVQAKDKRAKLEGSTQEKKLYSSNVVQAKDKSAKLEESTQEDKLYSSNVAAAKEEVKNANQQVRKQSQSPEKRQSQFRENACPPSLNISSEDVSKIIKPKLNICNQPKDKVICQNSKMDAVRDQKDFNNQNSKSIIEKSDSVTTTVLSKSSEESPPKDMPEKTKAVIPKEGSNNKQISKTKAQLKCFQDTTPPRSKSIITTEQNLSPVISNLTRLTALLTCYKKGLENGDATDNFKRIEEIIDRLSPNLKNLPNLQDVNPSNVYEVSKKEESKLKLHLKKKLHGPGDNRKKRKRFRNLYTENESDEDPPKSKEAKTERSDIDYSVYQRKSPAGVPKLVIKRRKSDIKNSLQPYVRINRLASIETMVKRRKRSIFLNRGAGVE